MDAYTEAKLKDYVFSLIEAHACNEHHSSLIQNLEKISS
jgi:hypothetical protein